MPVIDKRSHKKIRNVLIQQDNVIRSVFEQSNQAIMRLERKERNRNMRRMIWNILLLVLLLIAVLILVDAAYSTILAAPDIAAEAAVRLRW